MGRARSPFKSDRPLSYGNLSLFPNNDYSDPRENHCHKKSIGRIRMRLIFFIVWLIVYLSQVSQYYGCRLVPNLRLCNTRGSFLVTITSASQAIIDAFILYQQLVGIYRTPATFYLAMVNIAINTGSSLARRGFQSRASNNCNYSHNYK